MSANVGTDTSVGTFEGPGTRRSTSTTSTVHELPRRLATA